MKRLLAALFLALISSHASAQNPRPNIVVVMTDDQNVADLAFMPRTLSLLAKKGVTFTNSFTDYPLCCPSRVTFLTGQAAHNHQVEGNIHVHKRVTLYGYEWYRMLGEDETLPVWLQRAGYTTFHFGKYMNGYGFGSAEDRKHVPPGWDQWFGKINETAYQFYGYNLNENGSIVRYGCTAADYETDVTRDKSLAFIRAQQSAVKPFFMWIAPLAPHNGQYGDCTNFAPYFNTKPAERHKGMFADAPLDPSPSLNELDVEDKPSWVKRLSQFSAAELRQARMRQNHRREALASVDEMVRRIFFELSAIGQLDNTVLIFTSDNGYTIGQHRLREGKMWPYESAIRVPLIMRGPGIPANAKRTQMVTNTDLVATIVDLADATPRRVLDGKSLLQVIADASTPWRAALLFQGAIPGQLVYEPYVDPVTQPLVTYKAVRTRDAKYIEYDNGEREFYYLKEDADELNNRAGDTSFPGLKARMKNALNMLRNCVGRYCWMGGLPPP